MFRVFLAITLFFSPCLVVAQVPCRHRVVIGPPCNPAPFYQAPTVVREVIIEKHADVVTQVPIALFVPTYGAVAAPALGPVQYQPALPATQQLAGYADTNTQMLQLFQRQQVLLERLVAMNGSGQVVQAIPAKPAPVMLPPEGVPGPTQPGAPSGDGATFNASQIQDAVPFFQQTCAKCHSTSSKGAGKGFELLTDDGKISPSLTAKQVNRVLSRIEGNTMPPAVNGVKPNHPEATWHSVKVWGNNWFEAH